MNKSETVPFQPHHLVAINPPVMTADQLRQFEHSYRPAGPAFTVLLDGKVAGCGGVVVQGKIGRAWAMINDELRRKPVFLHRLVLRKLEHICAEFDLELIEAAVVEEFQSAQEWLKCLGFHYQRKILNYAGTPHTFVEFELCRE